MTALNPERTLFMGRSVSKLCLSDDRFAGSLTTDHQPEKSCGQLKRTWFKASKYPVFSIEQIFSSELSDETHGNAKKRPETNDFSASVF